MGLQSRAASLPGLWRFCFVVYPAGCRVLFLLLRCGVYPQPTWPSHAAASSFAVRSAVQCTVQCSCVRDTPTPTQTQYWHGNGPPALATSSFTRGQTGQVPFLSLPGMLRRGEKFPGTKRCGVLWGSALPARGGRGLGGGVLDFAVRDRQIKKRGCMAVSTDSR